MTSDLAAIARRQFGLVSHRQALTVVTVGQLKRLLASRRLEPVRRGVYRAAGTPENWHQHLLAACLASPGSVASFRSAAALWLLPELDSDSLEITVVGTRRVRLGGVIVHESQVWGSGHTATKYGIPTTSVARTLCDLTAVVPPAVVEHAVDDSLRRKLVSLSQLRRIADALDGKGRRRCTVMRTVLEDRLPGYDPGGSAPEVRIGKLLVARGLPSPLPQHRIRIGNRTVRVDLAYPDHGVVIEYDGWDSHRPRTAFNRDRARGNELELLGLTVLRFTSASSDAKIVETVGAALELAGHVAS